MEFRFVNSAASYNQDDIGLCDGQYFRLRRRDATTKKYGPTKPRAASATVTFAAIPMPGLKELYSFTDVVSYTLDANGAHLGSVLYRLSFDAGASWVYYNSGGAAWATSTSTAQMNTALEIDAALAALPASMYGTRNLSVQALLSSDATHQYTPDLFGVSFGVEVHVHPMEDAVRSVVRHIEQNISITLETAQIQETTGTSVTVSTPFTLVSVQAVYNLDDDPTCRTNLYLSGTAPVTLNASVASGKRLRIEFTGRAQATPGSEDELFDATLPAYGVVLLHSEQDRRWSNNVDIDISEGKQTGRTRFTNDYMELQFRFMCMAKRNTDAFNMVRAIQELFNTTQCIYIPTGEAMRLIRDRGLDHRDIEAESLRVKFYEAHLAFHAYTNAYEQGKLVQEVNIFVEEGGNDLGQITVSRT